MKKLFKDITNWKWFVLVAILLRGPLWLFFGHLVNVNLPPAEKLYSHFVKDDYLYFFAPVDNFFKTGTFSYLGGIPFTGRMPGYSIIYLLFRLLFSPQAAVYCVVATEFILSSLSVYLLALTAFKIFESKRAFYITYCLYVLAIFPGFFDFIIVAESFSVSSFVFCLYYLARYLKDGYRNKHLVLSGLFLTWTIFTREYTGLFIVIFPVALGMHHLFVKKDGFFKAIKVGFLFCLPFVVADGAWTTRNYLATGKIIPVTSTDEDAYGKLYSASWNALDDLAFVWGENGAPFDVSGLGYYFRHPEKNISYKFPDRFFKNVTTYNADSVRSLRKLYGIYYFTKDTTLEKSTEKRILSLYNLYRNDYISHNPITYWIIKPLKGVKYLLLFSGTGYLPMPPFSQCNSIEKLFKLIFCVLYYLVLLASIPGVFIYFKRNKTKEVLPILMFLACALIIVVIVIYCPIQEPRYAVHIFMMLVLFASYFIDTILPKRLN